MIGQIMNAFNKEVKALFQDTGTTVIREIQGKDIEMPLYTSSLVTIALNSSPDIQQLSGGAKQAEWSWSLKVYFYDANAQLNEDDGFSTETYNIIDIITNHFIKGDWITNEFKDITDVYSYKITLQGINESDVLQSANGLIQGYEIIFDSIGIDTSTVSTIYGAPLENANQQTFETPSFSASETNFNIAKIGETVNTLITSNAAWEFVNTNNWIDISKTVGIGDESINFIVAENETDISRSGTIILKAPQTNLSDILIIFNQL